MRIGFHLPIAKGFDHTLGEARRIGCEVVQIFVKNPRSWAEKRWTDRDMEAFGRLSADLPVVAHLSYLPNIARSDEEPRNLAGFLHEARARHGAGDRDAWSFIADRGRTFRRGIEVAARSVGEVLPPIPITVLLENAAGQGRALGKNVDELARIFGMVGDAKEGGLLPRHGPSLRSGLRREAEVDVEEPLLTELEAALRTGQHRVFPSERLEDRPGKRGRQALAHRKGEIGAGCFRFLVNEKKLAHLGGVMETPKMGNMDEENMKTMRGLLSPLVSRPFS